MVSVRFLINGAAPALQTMTEDKYEVQSCVPEAAIRVCSTRDPRLTLKITLSSLAMREEHGATEEGMTSRRHNPSPSLPPSFLCLLFYLTFM